jgi:hypothetical protein
MWRHLSADNGGELDYVFEGAGFFKKAVSSKKSFI